MVKTEGLVLARVNFPLYTIQMVTSHHVLVGGGGGSAKTGVANGFELFELNHNGKQFYVEERIRHETGDNVVMNCDVHSNGQNIYLVAGQENSNQLYKISPELSSQLSKISSTNKENKTSESSLRKRKDKDKGDNKENVKKNKEKTNKSKPEDLLQTSGDKLFNLTFKSFDCVQTVFSGPESLQRVVRLSRNGKLMVTGGTDGHLRLWSFPKMDQLFQIEAHSKEIDDVDFSISSNQIVSVAKDGKGFIWNCKNGSLLKELKWPTPDSQKYLFKRCRFGLVEDNQDKNVLFTISNPFTQNKKAVSYLQKWDADQGEISQSRDLNESLSALAVRDDGRYVAVGTMFTGSVFIYIAFSLQPLLIVPSAHNMFVTGLEFVPALPRAFDSSISSISDAAVLSISVDNKVCLHAVPHRCTISTKWALVLVFIVMVLTFTLLTILGL